MASRGVLALIRRQPFLCAAASGLLAGGIGDAAAQLCQPPHRTMKRRPEFDWRRWAGVASWGGICSSCLYLPFYRVLDQRVGTAISLQIVGLKVLLDDALFSPMVELPLFFAWTATVEGGSVLDRLRSEYLSTAAAAVLFNVPVTVLNFTIVPAPFRVQFIDTMEALRTALLSTIAHRSSAPATAIGDGTSDTTGVPETPTPPPPVVTLGPAP